LKVGAGAEKNSFGSATLIISGREKGGKYESKVEGTLTRNMFAFLSSSILNRYFLVYSDGFYIFFCLVILTFEFQILILIWQNAS
jgi:hypothetical protein